jgi:hypothetical protein
MGQAMLKILISGLVLSAVAASGASAATGRPMPAAVSTSAIPPALAHPVHAVLRYDTATTATCRSFSDDTSELCLLLALHVIRLSEKPLPGGAL